MRVFPHWCAFVAAGLLGVACGEDTAKPSYSNIVRNNSSPQPAAAANFPPEVGASHPVPKCSECGLTLAHVVTLGSPSDPEFIYRGAVPVRDSRGRYFALASNRRTIAVFDSIGRQTAVIGKAGEGPGEVNCIIFHLRIGRGDSLHTFGGCQHLVFDPGHKFVRSIAVPRGFMESVLVLPDGRAIIHALSTTQSARGYPIHMLALDGSVERSFGAEPGELIPGSQSSFKRQLALSHDSTFVWSLPVSRYQLERWNLDGTRTRVVSYAKSRWFHDWQPTPTVRGAVGAKGPVSSLPNILTSMEQLVATSRNTLLIRGTEPDASVSPLRPDGSKVEPVKSSEDARQRMANPPPIQWFPSRATVIDLFDLDRSEVVATGKWPGLQIQLMDHSNAFLVREDTEGRVLIDIFRVVGSTDRQ